MIKVLVVDDHPAVRSGLSRLIDATADLRVVGEAGCGEEAVAMTRELAPDVILMDLTMPNCDGIEATRRVIGEDPEARILVLTAHTDRKKTIQAITAGAIGYLVKDVEPPQLLEAIRTAWRGDSPLDARAARALVSAVAEAHLDPILSAREREIVTLLGYGLANKQIARRLGISEKTVKNHLTKIFVALGVSGRTAAALWAAQNGLTDASASARQELTGTPSSPRITANR